jgi:[CysO sulfur-carrier protein]-S-L-cysteine hydrolase
MLTISRALYEKIIEHARKDHPDEACGIIAGPAGSDSPLRFIPMQNAERSPTFYRFDSLEQLKVWREMDDRDEEAIVVYHSHTATQAYPSRTDISYASEPQAHYVLVSTRDESETEFRSYRIIDGEVTEEPVQIVQLSPGGMTPRTPRCPADPTRWQKPPSGRVGPLGRNDRVPIRVPVEDVLKFTTGALSHGH